MVIIFDVMKHFLNIAIENESKRLDTGWNTHLKEYKKEELEIISNAILTLQDQGSNKKNLDELKKIIGNCRSRLEAKCKEEQQAKGTFDTSLKEMSQLLDELFRTLGNKQLLDIVPEAELPIKPKSSNSLILYDDPLYIFYYYAALYIGDKVMAPSKGLTDQVTALFWSPIVVADEKETILLNALRNCKEALNALDKKQPTYPLSKTRRVLDFVEEVLRNNEKACSNHAALENVPMGVTLPYSLFYVKPTAKPSRGDLKVCMEMAKKQLKLMIDVLLQLKLSENPDNVGGSKVVKVVVPITSSEKDDEVKAVTKQVIPPAKKDIDEEFAEDETNGLTI
ncbi:hypothetical protein [Legionella hackeliae]|uniref:Coiled-coil protein n=1 Tax=Legionella hackeliae TaxID=449 RepID=A0A0A8UR99_LEGHA|nr:hypothetical protein [Legionella hackeliae]KTD13456.1 coiled-coil protein [Legionella hackeliae]CEK09299.1 protein of unknown function [Legionella hackeliae]STX49205.1 coiled-coil protein [Legionella hackeliae]